MREADDVQTTAGRVLSFHITPAVAEAADRVGNRYDLAPNHLARAESFPARFLRIQNAIGLEAGLDPASCE
jgi:hypothetical protein